MVRLLLERGADPALGDKWGCNALFKVRTVGSRIVVRVRVMVRVRNGLGWIGRG